MTDLDHVVQARAPPRERVMDGSRGEAARELERQGYPLRRNTKDEMDDERP